MIEMGVRQKHGVNLAWIEGKRSAIQPFEGAGTLEQSAIDEYPALPDAEFVAGAGNRLGGAMNRNRGYGHCSNLSCTLPPS